ncbi:protogenin B-like [Uloborus diversus]|uniref:protogenin B-like n=1 Tax=Uloborus diversus TaxID=327109 RepID=UPI00240A1F8E|nr:protogenin B-like [Uloborus diversus]
MAPRISSLYCLVIIALLIDYGEGGSLKLSLGFSTLSPPEVIALKNHPLLLNCSGYSEEGPLRISWRYQDIEITRDKHLQIFPNGSLFIDKLTPQKKRGNYTCVLRNNVGVLVSRPIHVILARMSKSFTVEPQPLTVYEGGQARFSCQISAVPAATISWYRDDIELPQNDSRYTLLPSGTLQITEVLMSDAGKFKCRCTNAGKQRNSSEAALNVLPRVEHFQSPVFLSAGGEVTAIAGNPAVLECFADGYPKVEYNWKREDGKEMPERFLGNQNLFFPEVQPDDSGSYICVAKSINKDANQITTATQKFSLNVYVPPKFTKVPVSQIIPTSQTVRFDCEVDGNPAPSIYWMKDGEQLYINGRIKLKLGNTLVVSQTVTTDSGVYQCVASNAAGVHTLAARLLVNASSEQPHSPSGLKAYTKSSSAILLTWDPVSSPAVSPIQAYTVHYVPTRGGMEQDIVAVNTSLVIERLKPFTNYSFYVRAYNNKSASEPSQPIVQMTGEDVPVEAPKISLSSLSPTVLHIQWNKLSIEKSRGIITGHRIFYRKHKQASSNVETISSGTEYTITGLQPKQKYDVRVLSGTKAGYPVLSDEAWPWITFEMPDVSTSKVPSPPTLHLTVMNATTLEVEWQMPAENSYPVEGFYLSYRQQNQPLKHRIKLSDSATKYYLHDLSPHSWYEVYIVAFNKNGQSRESVRTIITFSGDNPDVETVEVVEPPQQLEGEPTSPTSIRLFWKAPITNRNITDYTVRYHPVSSTGLVNESSMNYIRSTNTEVVIMDLQPYTLYEFSVRSHDSSKRQGPFSQPVECRTNEARPSPPEDLQWGPIDTKSVRLNWVPPRHPNGIITSYRVLYTTRFDQNLDGWHSVDEKGSESTTLLTGLASNTLYYLCMKAKNKAGFSPATSAITINIPVRHNNSKLPSQEMFDAEPPDPFLGIVLGISIGVGCIIICAFIIICRSRCCPTPPEPGTDGRYSICCGNGYIPQVNGNILRGGTSGNKRTPDVEVQEMECFTPMLNPYPNGSNDHHLDTKGGYPTAMCNGRANGFPQQLCGPSKSSSRSSADPVENPQASDLEDHPASKHRMRYNANDCRVPESSWRDESADITSSTVLLESEEQNQSKNTSLAETSTSIPWESESPSLGAKNEAESSCNTESADSTFKATPETLTTSTVPPVLPTSLHHLPSDSFSSVENDQNHVPSDVASDERDARGKKDIFVSVDDGETSRPFSVNAFLSPLSGPRFSQSSGTIPSTEPT